MADSLSDRLQEQQFGNEYALVNGVEMNRLHGSQFKIPAPVLKRHLKSEFFVELRIDSPRFSMHEEDAGQCECPSCKGEFSKPVLRHEMPLSLFNQPVEKPPARGWGEDFWVQISECDGQYFAGRVDNDLCEAKLHGIELNDQIFFHADHVLAVHGSHRLEIVSCMNVEEVKELATWLSSEHFDGE